MYADYESLSLYHRLADRNNGAIEGCHNGSISLEASDNAYSARVFFFLLFA